MFSKTASKQLWSGNGTDNTFNITDFYFRKNEHVHVSVFVGGVAPAVSKTEGVNYTLTGAGDEYGGQITWIGTVPALGDSVLAERVVPYTQESDYENLDGTPSDVLEGDLDLAAMREQQLKDGLDRSFKVPVEVTGFNPELVGPYTPGAALIIGVDGESISQTDTDISVLEGNAQIIADNISDIDTVATNIANVNTVAGISAATSTVSGIASNVTTVAGIEANVSTVAGISSSVSTVAANIVDVQNAEENANLAAESAAKLTGNSTSSVAIGTGSKSFTTQASKFFDVGNWLMITDDAAPSTNWMHGQVTVYDSGTGALTVLVSSTGGSGTKTAWTIRVSGAQGAPGAVSDGDKGDITVSTSGSVWTVDNDAITYAKMQNVSATDKLLGRATAGAGDVEEITCTAFARTLLDDADATTARATLGVVFGKSFTTSDLSIATSGSATVAHSLGGVPKIIRGFLKCTTAEYGFSVGDVVAYDSTNNRDSAGIMIITCGSDASNIIVRFGSSGNISVARKDTNADQAITLANWRYYVQAFI